MISVDQYKLIRKMYVVEGLSQRQIAKILGIIRALLEHSFCLQIV